MGAYPRWEDVSIKVKHNVTEDIYRFFVPRSIPAKDLLKKVNTLFKISANECTVYYMDDEKTWVVLESDDDLNCAFNRRQKRDGPGVDYGPKPVYFLRLLVKPKRRENKSKKEEKADTKSQAQDNASRSTEKSASPQVKDHGKKLDEKSVSHEQTSLVQEKKKSASPTLQEDNEPVLVGSFHFSDIDKSNPAFNDCLWK